MVKKLNMLDYRTELKVRVKDRKKITEEIVVANEELGSKGYKTEKCTIGEFTVGDILVGDFKVKEGGLITPEVRFLKGYKDESYGKIDYKLESNFVNETYTTFKVINKLGFEQGYVRILKSIVNNNLLNFQVMVND